MYIDFYYFFNFYFLVINRNFYIFADKNLNFVSM